MAEAREVAAVRRDSRPVAGFRYGSLHSPQSTTNDTPSMVRDVSAMLVAKIARRLLGCDRWNRDNDDDDDDDAAAAEDGAVARCCIACGRPA